MARYEGTGNGQMRSGGAFPGGARPGEAGSGEERRCRILIVEDELIVRKALRYIIEQESMDFEIIGEVTNGEEALEFLERRLPHIMICDIRMPRMDGLELLRTANLRFPEISSIVLSGFHDFEYVKKAFRYGVADYILKPELESGHLLKELHDLARKMGLGQAMESKAEGDGGTDGAYPLHYLVMLQPGPVLRGAPKKQGLIVSHMEENLRECFGRMLAGSFVLERRQIYVYAVGSLYPEMFDERLGRLTEASRDYLRNVEMIVSAPVDGPDSYREEAERLAPLFPHSFFDDGRQILDLRNTPVSVSGPPALDQRAFFNLIRQHRADQASRMLGEYLSALKDGPPVSEQAVKKLMESMLYNAIFELDEAGSRPQGLEEKKLTFLSAIGQADSLGRLIEVVDDTYREIAGMIGDGRTGDLSARITEYIHRHYSEPVTLKGLAEDFNMNYSYLSSYFSSHMGQGMNEFLNSIRVEKAKELLSFTDLPLSDIAQKIGYTDQSYFGKVFKKQTGISPHTYRLRARRQV